MLSTNYSFTNPMDLLHICINKIWHKITYKGWYTIKPNQPTNFQDMLRYNTPPSKEKKKEKAEQWF